MKKKVFGLLLMVGMILAMSAIVLAAEQPNEIEHESVEVFLEVVDDYEMARDLYAPFGAITPDQHYAFSQMAELTAEQVQELLGLNIHRHAFIVFERSFLETLTDKEIDELMEPFREALSAINNRYGTSMSMPYIHLAECWENPASMREASINILSGGITFDEWFSAARQNVVIVRRHLQHRAHAAMVIDGRLSVEEFIEIYSFDAESDTCLQSYPSYIDIVPLDSVHLTRTNMLFSDWHGHNRYEFVVQLTATASVDRSTGRSIFHNTPAPRMSRFFQQPGTVPLRWTWNQDIWAPERVVMSANREQITVTLAGRLRDNVLHFDVLTNPPTIFLAGSWIR
jgi:hypothetical protein